jgi:pimeloyl-ACP methyl ester carboxylesterase
MARKTLGFGVAILAAVFVLVVVIGPLFMRPNPRLLATATPASVGLGFESVEFTPADVAIKLRAWWIPAENAKASLVMAHGGGEDNRSLPYGHGLELMRDLTKHGYSVLALDLRIYGESDASPEQRPSFGVREANDVIAAIDYLASRRAGDRYGAIGFSMGGSTVLYAAARDRRIEAAVSDSGFADSSAVAVNFVHAAMGIPPWFSRPLLWSADRLHGMELSAGRAIDVVGAIAPRRLLVIHDQTDPIVPVEQARALAAACPGADLWITDTSKGPGDPFGTHIKAYMNDPQAYVTRVTQFFDATFAR